MIKYLYNKVLYTKDKERNLLSQKLTTKIDHLLFEILDLP